MQLNIFAISLFAATVSAGYVQLCGPQGCTDVGDANSNLCFGPIQGKGKFTLIAHDTGPRVSMSIFKDKCYEKNAAFCEDCNKVEFKGEGPVWGIFH
ncbi:hypothetical protein FQN49_005381 [Arthroderma sp. PD_2]|nr:hypothetical protein FQN49_005381 [Arthroderma sp. PD_2]